MIYGVQGKVVLRIGFVVDSLHLTVTTQESATKHILKTTLVQGGVCLKKE